MANVQNLIPGNKLTPEEARENGRKGGIASGEARRRAKSFREAAEIVLNQLVDRKDKNGNVLEKITGYEAILLGQLDEAIRKHNTRAAKFIADVAQPKRIELTGADGQPLQAGTTYITPESLDEIKKHIADMIKK